MTQQFLAVTSKVKQNCNYTCQQSMHMRAWERGCNFYTTTHFSALSTAHWLLFQQSTLYDRNAVRNLCCASVILSIHTHILGLCMGKEYILCKGHAINKGVFFSHTSILYLTTICTYMPPLYLAFSAFEHNAWQSYLSAIWTWPLTFSNFLQHTIYIAKCNPISNFYFHFTFINTLYCPSASLKTIE